MNQRARIIQANNLAGMISSLHLNYVPELD
jgi:hypothetical protein